MIVHCADSLWHNLTTSPFNKIKVQYNITPITLHRIINKKCIPQGKHGLAFHTSSNYSTSVCSAMSFSAPQVLSLPRPTEKRGSLRRSKLCLCLIGWHCDPVGSEESGALKAKYTGVELLLLIQENGLHHGQTCCSSLKRKAEVWAWWL